MKTLIVIAIIVVVFFIVVALRPDNFRVERSMLPVGSGCRRIPLHQRSPSMAGDVPLCESGSGREI